MFHIKCNERWLDLFYVSYYFVINIIFFFLLWCINLRRLFNRFSIPIYEKNIIRIFIQQAGHFVPQIMHIVIAEKFKNIRNYSS